MNDDRLEAYDPFSDIIKHEARLKLWLPILKQFKNDLGRHLKYFTLPSSKAFDVIRWKMEDLILYDGRGFPEVCFCEKDKNNYANAKRILGNTRGINDRFENVILSNDKKNFRAFLDLFPYDVYNLDFCDTGFEKDEPLSKTFVTIVELVNAHVSHKKFTKFAVFLTLRIDKDRTNPQVINDLKSNLQDNLVSHGVSNNDVHIDNLDDLVESKFHIFMMISIPKLIASKIIPRTERYSGKILELRRVYYSRREGKNHIGKFVFIIDREKADLRHNPEWYKDVVKKALDVKSIMEIRKDYITEESIKDLEYLNREIRKIEEFNE